MNTELVTHVETLHETAQLAKTGDISTLAEMLGQLETLGRLADAQELTPLHQPIDALGDQLKRLIMGTVADDTEAIQTVREALHLIHDAVGSGQLPPLQAYPDALHLVPEEEPADEGKASEEGAFSADTELLAEYLAEQRGRLEEIEGYLLALEKSASQPDLAGLRRALHTIKGDSGFLGLSQVTQISHAAESYLEEAKFPYDLECLFAVKDWLSHAFEDLARTGGISPATGDGFAALVETLEHHSHEDEPPATRDSRATFEQQEPEAEPAVLESGATAAAPVESAEAEAPAPAAPAESAEAETPAPAAPVESAEAETPAAPVESAEAETPAPAPAAPVESAEAETPAPAPAAPVESAEAETPAAPEESAEAPASPKQTPASVQLTADESLLVDFISESREHLDMASSQLLTLENDPQEEEALNSVFRAFHTIKGIAGFLNLGEISVLAHDTENLLDQVRRGSLELTPGLIDLVFEALDWMGRLIGNVADALRSDGKIKAEAELPALLGRIKDAQAGKTVARKEAPPAAASSPQPRKKDAALVPRLGEILVESGAVTQTDLEEAVQDADAGQTGKKLGETLVEKKMVSASTVHQALKRQHEEKNGGRQAVELKETIRVDYDRLESMIDTVGELVLAEAMISQDDLIVDIKSENLTKKLYNLRMVSRKLQELGTTIRMVPISGTFQKMARLVRDLSRKSGKPINFHSQGDETELDRAYVDMIADPLVHMIRNAVDHGIESPQDRVKAGKKEFGVIELRAYHEGGNIHVEVSDNGQGLDRDKILAKALERGLVSKDTEITEQEIYQLIFEPGFSTASQVTEVSGRGVGMDVVRRNIAELRGQVQITSQHGAGSTFKITLPLTLALIDGMLVKVGEERFIFPVLSVVESTRPTADMVNSIVGKGEMISLRNRQLPLYRLANIFGIPGAKEDVSDALVVVVENGGKLIGIMVDDLVGMQQTVIKSVGGGLFRTTGLSGGTIMPDGRVGLIVDVSGLIQLARGSGGNSLSS